VSLHFEVISITFTDNSVAEQHDITRWTIKDDCLHLFYQSGEVSLERHVGSYPLANIRTWKRANKYS
jgi:hypothetical protein